MAQRNKHTASSATVAVPADSTVLTEQFSGQSGGFLNKADVRAVTNDCNHFNSFLPKSTAKRRLAKERDSICLL